MRSSLLISAVLALSTTTCFCASDDYAGSASTLSISQTTQVPGDTLKSGEYSIRVLDQLSDRMIVRIDSTTGKHHAIFLGVPSSATKLGEGSGAILWTTGLNKTAALRGFNFANGKSVEFVYPKADAAALAKENTAKVLAVDPQSEGHTALKSLSKDELAMVNLWMLSLTTTGPDNKTPAVLAQRYDNSRGAEQPVVAANVQQVQPVPSTPTQQVASVETPAMPVAAPAKTVRVPRRATTIASLPHTGGFLPMIWMLGLLSLAGSALVRFGRGWMMRRVVS